MTVPRILIFDDNPYNVKLASFVLERAAFIIEAVLDSTLAMACVAAFRPDLILMDIQMPKIDGLELMRCLKADPALCRIPVVAFTAYAMHGDQDKLLAAGCDGYLSKPINVATFADEVRALLAPKPVPTGSP